MGTVLRSKLSPKSPYWIPKHRRLELMHFCLQYDIWKEELVSINYHGARGNLEIAGDKNFIDPTGSLAINCERLSRRVRMVEEAARRCDSVLGDYILEAVTKGLSYEIINCRRRVPCGKSVYYNYYKKFFYILDKIRD